MMQTARQIAVLFFQSFLSLTKNRRWHTMLTALVLFIRGDFMPKKGLNRDLIIDAASTANAVLFFHP